MSPAIRTSSLAPDSVSALDFDLARRRMRRERVVVIGRRVLGRVDLVVRRRARSSGTRANPRRDSRIAPRSRWSRRKESSPPRPLARHPCPRGRVSAPKRRLPRARTGSPRATRLAHAASSPHAPLCRRCRLPRRSRRSTVELEVNVDRACARNRVVQFDPARTLRLDAVRTSVRRDDVLGRPQRVRGLDRCDVRLAPALIPCRPGIPLRAVGCIVGARRCNAYSRPRRARRSGIGDFIDDNVSLRARDARPDCDKSSMARRSAAISSRASATGTRSFRAAAKRSNSSRSRRSSSRSGVRSKSGSRSTPRTATMLELSLSRGSTRLASEKPAVKPSASALTPTTGIANRARVTSILPDVPSNDTCDA